MAKFDPRLFRRRFILIDQNTDPPTEKMNCVCCGTLTSELYEMALFCKACFLKWKEANDLICERCTQEMGQNTERICNKCRKHRSFMMQEMLM